MSTAPPIVEKTTRWTPEDEEVLAEIVAERAAKAAEPVWLEHFEPDTILSHNGWECRILTVQPVPDGRSLVLIQPLCTTAEARGKLKAQMKRRGFAEKKIVREVRRMFPAEET